MSGLLEEAIAKFRAGDVIVLAGDRLRPGAVEFAVAAQLVTPEKINFMATHGQGLICLVISPARALKLGIGLINPGVDRQSGRPFGRSIEAREGVSTGISAADRAHTVRVAIADDATADDLVSPGHVFPLIAAPGGIAERQAAMEGAIELCLRAGLADAAVICSIMRDDGEMARVDDIAGLVEAHDLRIVDISDLLPQNGSQA